jgi:hypothetical protein
MGREVSHDSLYLITGCDKCESWGIASYSDESDDCDVCLTWTAAPVAEGHASYGYSWETYSPVTVRVGPDRFGRGLPEKKNQCVFVRGFKIAVREGPWAKIFGSVNLASIRESNARKLLPHNSNSFTNKQKDTSSSFKPNSSGISSSSGSRRRLTNSDEDSESESDDSIDSIFDNDHIVSDDDTTDSVAGMDHVPVSSKVRVLVKVTCICS